jgi:hypothetical protein
MSTAQVENPFAGQGSVMLDIGGDVGALVVTMPQGMAGVEVEIRPLDARGHQHGHHAEDVEHVEHAHHPHVAVVDRPVADRRVPSLVFPELVEGSYELYEKETDDVRLTVDVRGSEVTAAHWPI